MRKETKSTEIKKNMKDDNFQELENMLSKERFATYLAEMGGNRQDAIRLYIWNTAVGASFYGPLQALEIALRNQIHAKLSEKYGIQWYGEQSDIKFNDKNREQLDMTEARLGKKKFSTDPPGVVADLSFGFWVILLSSHYTNLWHPMLYKVFPHAAPATRRNIHEQLQILLDLRNKIAHHRPIFRMGEKTGKNLSDYHQDILKTIGWMSPRKKEWVEMYSRVEEILARNPKAPDLHF